MSSKAHAVVGQGAFADGLVAVTRSGEAFEQLVEAGRLLSHLLLLERYRFDDGARSGRLLDFVENRAVDVIGEYVVFPLASERVSEELRRRGLPQPDERIISVPARGAFAEAKLSHCNACEEIDDTRYWDWQESPCGCDAPEIAPVTAGTRDRETGADSAALPDPLLTVVTPEAAPEPSGMAAVLELLGESDLFRNMSTSVELAGVMKSLADGAVQLELERVRGQNQQAAADAAVAADDRRKRQASSSQTAAPARTEAAAPSPVRQRDQAFRQATNTTNRAQQNGDLTAAEAQQQRWVGQSAGTDDPRRGRQRPARRHGRRDPPSPGRQCFSRRVPRSLWGRRPQTGPCLPAGEPSG